MLLISMMIAIANLTGILEEDPSEELEFLLEDGEDLVLDDELLDKIDSETFLGEEETGM